MILYPRLDDLLELRHQARALGVAAHHLVNSTFSGLYSSVFRGTGLDFEEVRDYREGDDIRNMDWRVTARAGEPHVKLYTEERERPVVVMLDLNPGMFFGTRGAFKSVIAARAAAAAGGAGRAACAGTPNACLSTPAASSSFFPISCCSGARTWSRCSPNCAGCWRPAVC